MAREKDIIDTIESIVAKDGQVVENDDSYYEDFMKLNLTQVEKLVILLLFNEEKAIRKRQMDAPRADQVGPTAENIQRMLFLMSRGRLQVNVFGQLRIAAIGEAMPSPKMEARLNAFLEEIHPFVRNTIKASLPWLLSREKPQPELPL